MIVINEILFILIRENLSFFDYDIVSVFFFC